MASVNKIIYGGKVLLDLTGDTVAANKLLTGFTAHDKSGAVITGSCTFDSDTSDATATADEVLKGKTAYVAGAKVTGSMPNNGAATLEISVVSDVLKIPVGYHDGSGVAKISDTEKAKIVANNIRENVTILGIKGTMSTSEGMKPQAKSATPKTTVQTILPDTGYNCLSQVTIAAIPYTETENASGGLTVTIAG